MAGNVSEWVADWFDGYPGTAFQSDEFGAQYKVMRGGSWVSEPLFVRSAGRGWYAPDGQPLYNGFRCAAATTP